MYSGQLIFISQMSGGLPFLRRELNLGRQRHLLKKTALHWVIWGHNPELSNEKIYASHLLCARHCAKYIVSIMKLFEH